MTTSAVRAPEATKTSTPPNAAGPGGLTHRQIMTILVGLMLGMFLAALDMNIVGVAMPRIANDLHGLNIQAWVTTAYLITSTITTPLYGKLSDLYGRKPFYLLAISLFLVGSIASTFATSMYELAAFRAFQGLGAGGLMSLAFTILADIISPRERAKYMGYFLAVFGTSSVLGPVIGGALSGANSILGIPGWRWVFLVNVPIGAVALIVVAKVLNLPHTRRANHKIDWWGAVSLVIGLVPLLIVAQQGQQWGWGDVKSIVCYAVTGVGLLAFVLIELAMKDHALIPMRLFRSSTFSLIIVSSVLIGIGMFGGMTLIPQYLQIVRGYSPTSSGLLMLPMMVGLMAASLISGQITSRTGRYKMFPIIGGALLVVGSLLLTQLKFDSAMWQPMVDMLIYGFGVGLCMQTLNLAAQNAAPARDMGVATASATFFRQTGGTLGVAVFLSVMFSSAASKIGSAIRSAFGQPYFQSALHDQNVLHNPVNKPVLAALSGHGGNLGGMLQDASFLQTIDSRLAQPFKIGLSQSIDLVFLVAAAVAALAFIVVWFIKEIPLRTQSGMQAAAVEGAAEVMVDDLEPETAPVPEPAMAAPIGGGRHALNGSEQTTRLPALDGLGPAGGTAVTGTVRHAAGTPVPGAVLTLINHSGQQVARGTSDRAGAFRLTAPLDGSYVLIASSAGHQPQATPLRAAGAEVTLDVVLAGTARTTGVVRAADGTVVPGATVTVTDARGEVIGSAITGPDGRYGFDELPAGGYTLVAAAGGYRPTATALTVRDSGDTVADVELSTTARLTGIAVGGPNGRPVPDARVTLVDGGGTVVAMTTTDDSGAYAFPDVPEGEYTVIASGYPPVTSYRQVTAGEDGRHDLRLSHSDI